MDWVAENLGEARRRRAAFTVLLMSMVMVMGPTPRGKIAEQALRFASVGDAVGADVDDRSAGLDPIGFHVGCFTHGGDDDVRAAHHVG